MVAHHARSCAAKKEAIVETNGNTMQCCLPAKEDGMRPLRRRRLVVHAVLQGGCFELSQASNQSLDSCVCVLCVWGCMW